MNMMFPEEYIPKEVGFINKTPINKSYRRLNIIFFYSATGKSHLPFPYLAFVYLSGFCLFRLNVNMAAFKTES